VASIDAPVASAGTLYNRDERGTWWGVSMFIRSQNEDIHLACFYPMPFFRSAVRAGRLWPGGVPGRLADPSTAAAGRPHVGYFHATCGDHPQPPRGHDLWR
jgi:hypothetical protein